MSFCRAAQELILDNLDLILSLRRSVIKKPDNSLVTEGDLLIQNLLIDLASSMLPDFSIVSEEQDNSVLRDYSNVIVIDPIDGTENFASGLKEWGVGISIYAGGVHSESMIMLPELGSQLHSGQQIDRFNSRVVGLSSSLVASDLHSHDFGGREIRIIGCAMYNLLSAVTGAFYYFVNIKGVNCWDLLPGINLALEHGVPVYIDGEVYDGWLLTPDKKYTVLIGDGCNEFLC